MRQRRRAAVGCNLRRARFDVFGDFRKRGSCIRRGKLQPVVLRRIVAGGEVDRAIELAPHDFVSYGRRWRKRLAQQCADAVMLQDVHGELRKFLRIEARVVPDQNRRLL